MDEKRMDDVSKPLHLTDPAIKWIIEDGVINGVIAAAVWSEKRRPGIWQDMIRALYAGAAGTEKGTVNAFLHQAMVDRLLEEFHKLDSQGNR